ncbi:MAG: hypothetical protein QM530_06960 [Phycisphaerales bacterium]|nr:hypothetical protein [Phycisphaerales bacterium]
MKTDKIDFMDIAKYIGLFLQKNNYCCLQGLGNLEIKRTPVKHNGTELAAGSYFAKLNPVGSLDDAFPNFVATNEQVSIARASNEISDFIKASKSKIADGGSIEIPAIGKYLLKNNQLYFELDPAFSMPTRNIVFPIAEKPNPVLEDTIAPIPEKPYESYSNYNVPKSVNWNIVAFWSVVAIIGGSILIWSVRYFMNQQQNHSSATISEIPVNQNLPSPSSTTDSSIAQAPVIDSAAEPVNASPTSVLDTPEYQFVIKTYSTMAAAHKREKQLNSYGYNVTVMPKDSNTFMVVKAIKVSINDTARMKDSLSRILNPAGITILH